MTLFFPLGLGYRRRDPRPGFLSDSVMSHRRGKGLIRTKLVTGGQYETLDPSGL
jgi:hypothetical protein